jgi:hypothetical protein
MKGGKFEYRVRTRAQWDARANSTDEDDMPTPRLVTQDGQQVDVPPDDDVRGLRPVDQRLTEDILTLLVWSDEYAPQLAEHLNPQIFDQTGDYRILVECALDHIKETGRPAQAHLINRIEKHPRIHSHSQRVVLGQIVTQLAETNATGGIQGDYVMQHVARYIRARKLVQAISRVSNILTDQGNLEEGEDILRSVLPPAEPVAVAPLREAPKLSDVALYGLAGKIVKTIEPHTETSPAALLFQFLTAFGNRVGHNPYFRVEADRHHAVLFIVAVGRTAKGRKGISWNRVRSVFERDDDWLRECVFTGALGSGEGLVHRIRDRDSDEDDEEEGDQRRHRRENDKRIQIVTTEFGNQLRIIGRAGATASGIIRDMWDCPRILHSPLIKSSRERATTPHGSVIGHITMEELKRDLTATEIANGFGNRFLYVYTERTKLLPMGGDLDAAEIDMLAGRVEQAARVASQFEEVTFDRAAQELWEERYAEISAERPGLLGSITARAEAQTRRLALIYTLQDRSRETRVEHLEAAMAAWEYCLASAAYIFGDAVGDPVADKILSALRQAGEKGMSRWDISNLLKGHESSARISQALSMLKEGGLIASSQGENRGGRSSEIWHAVR